MYQWCKRGSNKEQRPFPSRPRKTLLPSFLPPIRRLGKVPVSPLEWTVKTFPPGLKRVPLWAAQHIVKPVFTWKTYGINMKDVICWSLPAFLPPHHSIPQDFRKMLHPASGPCRVEVVESRQLCRGSCHGARDPIWRRSLAGFYRANEGEKLMKGVGPDDKAGHGKRWFYGACKPELKY